MPELIFITEEDIRTVIRDEFFKDIHDEDADIQEKSELSAISKMSSYLRGRYDVDKIFSPSEEYGDKQLIIEYCVDIFMYRLHARINPRKIPEIRKVKYDEAIEWLMGVQQGELHPDLPALPEDETSSADVRFGNTYQPKDHYF